MYLVMLGHFLRYLVATFSIVMFVCFIGLFVRIMHLCSFIFFFDQRPIPIVFKQTNIFLI
jgi:hypothetical protein